MSNTALLITLADAASTQENSFVRTIICLIGLIGIICAFYSILHIKREEKILSHNDNDIIKEFNNSENNKITLTEFIKKLETKLIAKENGNKAASRNHFCVRINAMLAPLKEKDKNKSCELPRLHDLHELTLQEELSRFSSSSMRTIVSILLICGIFGTLNGVHSCLKEGFERDITKLAPALEPSMWAVGLTVFLMILRGVYTKMVDAYLSKLDSLTMTLLTPRLQPPSNLGENLNNLGEKIQDFKEGMQNFYNSTQGINDAANAFQNSSNKLDGVSATLDIVINDVKNSISQIRTNSKEHAEAIKITRERVNAVQQASEPLQNICKILEQTLVMFSANVDRTNEQYVALQQKLEDAMKVISNESGHLKEASDAAGRIQEYVDGINAFQGKLSTFAIEQQKIGEHVQQMHVIEQNISEIATQASKDMAETAGIAENFANEASAISKKNKEISTELNQNFSNTNQRFSSMQAKLQVLEGNTKQFAEAVGIMTKRTKVKS